MLNNIKNYIIFFTLLIWVNGFSTASELPKTVTLTFGLYQSDKASEMHHKFKPLINYLSEDISRQTGTEVKVKLKIYRTYQQASEALINGSVDFVRFGPASYILAKQQQPKIQLLAMEQKKGKTRFNGLIVVLNNSPVQSLADLKGQSFAFGNQRSTIGRYLAQSELLQAGIHAKDLANSAFLGRHDKVFKAVELGDFTAGSLKEATFKKMNKKAQLRILHSFNNVTKPWIARAGLPLKLSRSLSGALIGLKNPDILKKYKVSGFVAVTDDDYQYVRDGMARALQF